MSLKSEWKKWEGKWKAWWAQFKERHLVAEDPGEREGRTGAPRQDGDGAARGWPTPARASCWEKKASVRHMNTLSGKFPEEVAEDRFRWAAERGCNAVHLFVCNQGDGEGAGYSIYGGAPKIGVPDGESAARMRRRISLAHGKGLAVALWLMADDSAKWNKALLGDPEGYVADLRDCGLLEAADCVVLGLELDEYASESQVAALEKAVRGAYSGPVGVHHTGGKAPFAKHGDIVFWQVDPGKSAAQIAEAVQKARKSTGKPVDMFEAAREPARALCEAALAAGAVGVGNW
ncbi:MAG: hypothetical protein IK066_04500 [Kiritimatiellae bacterium]|nr:hypothetical protein [Kiritimatiellia bacterium]